MYIFCFYKLIILANHPFCLIAEDTQKSHAQIDFNITYFQLIKPY